MLNCSKLKKNRKFLLQKIAALKDSNNLSDVDKVLLEEIEKELKEKKELDKSLIDKFFRVMNTILFANKIKKHVPEQWKEKIFSFIKELFENQ